MTSPFSVGQDALPHLRQREEKQRYSLGRGGTLAFYGSLAVLMGGIFHQSFIASRGYDAQTSAALQPRRDKFVQVCSSQNDQTIHDGSLRDIVDGRDRYLENRRYSGPSEEWKCQREKNGTYQAVFIPRTALESVMGLF